MRLNRIKVKLREGKVCLGTMVFEFSTTGIGRIAAAAGAEFVLFDMEHTGWSMETVRSLLATTRAAEVVPLVRVPATEYHFIARVLDMGAMGIMVPMVESEQQARHVVASTKYPPAGRRGAAFAIAHDDYLDGDVMEKMHSANEQTLVIAQIETKAGLDNVERIAAVEGLDVLWIGQFDLTASLGIPGRFDHAEFQNALGRVVEAAEQNGKACGYMAVSVEEAEQLHERGFRCLAYGGDLWIYQQALRQGIATLQDRFQLV